MSERSTEIPILEIVNPRMTAFLAYWQSLRDDRLAPAWREFDLMALDLTTIPNVLVVDVAEDPLDFTYRFWGTAHVRAKGCDKTGRKVSEPPRFRGTAAFEEYKRVFDEKRPVAAWGKIELPELGRAPFIQTVLRLPLSDDGETVDKVVTLAIWESTDC